MITLKLKTEYNNVVKEFNNLKKENTTFKTEKTNLIRENINFEKIIDNLKAKNNNLQIEYDRYRYEIKKRDKRAYGCLTLFISLIIMFIIMAIYGGK